MRDWWQRHAYSATHLAFSLVRSMGQTVRSASRPSIGRSPFNVFKFLYLQGTLGLDDLL